MNYPRRVRLRRFLLLVPFALLGTALLVRSRLPHPQTEGDKWLWEMGERIDYLRIAADDSEAAARQVPLAGLKRWEFVSLGGRQRIRGVLRALKISDTFHPVPSKNAPDMSAPVIKITYEERGGQQADLSLLKLPSGFFLYRERSREHPNVPVIATVSSASALQFLQVLRSHIVKARREEEGMSVGAFINDLPPPPRPLVPRAKTPSPPHTRPTR